MLSRRIVVYFVSNTVNRLVVAFCENICIIFLTWYFTSNDRMRKLLWREVETFDGTMPFSEGKGSISNGFRERPSSFYYRLCYMFWISVLCFCLLLYTILMTYSWTFSDVSYRPAIQHNEGWLFTTVTTVRRNFFV